MAQATPFPVGEAQERLLREGRIKARGLLPDCSNYTYLAQVRGREGAETLGVYKPAEAETPLDDFPDGTLGEREVAAYLLTLALYWQVVPRAVYRDRSSLWPGSQEPGFAQSPSARAAWPMTDDPRSPARVGPIRGR